jgi:hypothetical protein
MVALHENSIIITIPTEEPSAKLAELQSGLIYVLNDFFGHLGNEVDTESGAAYNDLIRLLQATMPTPEQLAGIAATKTAPRADE